MPLRYTSAGQTAGPLDLIDRAQRYVAKMPPAVTGQHGHDQTFAVACALVQGFGLSPAEAGPLMRDYNARCVPPWSERELAHKLASAEKAAPPLEGRGHLAAAPFTGAATPPSRPSVGSTPDSCLLAP